MMTLTFLVSTCLVLVCTQLPDSYTFTVDDTETQDRDFYPSLPNDPETYTWEQSQFTMDTPQKRAPSVSINQDLVSLASMLRNAAGQRRIQAASSFLNRIGKRSQPEVYQSLQGIPSPLIPGLTAGNDGQLDTPEAFHRSTRRISVNVPLDALSQMIRTQRRRKLDARMTSVHNKLGEIGKRSVEE